MIQIQKNNFHIIRLTNYVSFKGRALTPEEAAKPYKELYPEVRKEHGDLFLYYKTNQSIAADAVGFRDGQREVCIKTVDAVKKIAEAKKRDKTIFFGFYGDFLDRVAVSLEANIDFKESETRKIGIGKDIFAIELTDGRVLKISREKVVHDRREEEFDAPILSSGQLGEFHYYIQPVVDTENVTAKHVDNVIQRIKDAGYTPHDISGSKNPPVSYHQVGLLDNKPVLIDWDCAGFSRLF